MKLTWAVEQRVNWIKESVEIFGFINRKHIMKKFRMSGMQASADLTLVQKLHPNLIRYDTSQRQYLRK
jgi:hypothetical protein